jgi:hypothetical protein
MKNFICKFDYSRNSLRKSFQKYQLIKFLIIYIYEIPFHHIDDDNTVIFRNNNRLIDIAISSNDKYDIITMSSNNHYLLSYSIDMYTLSTMLYNKRKRKKELSYLINRPKVLYTYKERNILND